MGSGLGEIRRFDTNTDTEIAIGRVGYPSSKERAKQRERVEERGSVTGQTRTRRNRLAITERKRKGVPDQNEIHAPAGVLIDIVIRETPRPGCSKPS